jgi:hypothetical protein
MPEEGNALSRNPNICASCSSMADGMDDATPCETTSLAPGQEPTSATTEASARGRRENEAAEPVVRHFSI